jgi:bifunctional non-homologous end joining protein LigD
MPPAGAPPLPVGPMLATPGPPPAGAGFFAEAKWDGARGIARVHGGGVDLISRPGNNFCSRFPDLTESLAQSLGGHSAILDGEVIARDGHGRPSFARLQRRLRVQRPSRTLLSSVPASFCLFDVLHVDGQDLTSRPYAQRRALLEDLALSGGPIVVPPVWQDLPGAVLLAAAAELDLEGAVFKRSDSTYHAGRRSRSWIKCPIRKRAIVAVIGWTRGRAEPVGALAIGAHDSRGNLVYCGTVTSGLGQANRRALHQLLCQHETSRSPLADHRDHALGSIRWVKPRLIGAIDYREYTGRRFRHPAWKGLVTASLDAAVLPAIQ